MTPDKKNKGKKPRLLIVEGNIGAGKSTFLKIIQEKIACQVVFEPHEKWQNISGKGNLLQNFYTAPSRWAYTFQSYAFITRTLAQKQSAKKCPYDTQVLERSVFSDKYCFAKNLYESGMMSDLEWTLYQEWFNWFFEDHIQKPDGFIYLRTTPETCYSRLKKRNRNEEKTLPLEYLQKLHEKHERWLIEAKDLDYYVQDVPVLILDCNKEFEADDKEKNRLIKKITDFFNINLYQPAQQNEKKSSLSL